jgi:molybdate transport system substrate-binding protein
MQKLHVLSAGAAQSLIEKLQQEFAASDGIEIRASFHPVGATMDKLLAGEPCDVVVLTAALLGELAQGGDVRPESIAPLGRVRTAIAVREGDAAPDVSTAAALRQLFLAADAIHLPDVERSTAGAHCAAMLRSMGIGAETAPNLRQGANGVAAMRELAQSPAVRPVGCTQVTEIACTPGVTLVGPLPGEFDLATLYCVAVAARAQQPESAARFAALLTGPATSGLRGRCGFDS